VDRRLVVGLGEDNTARRSDCLSMVRESYRRVVAGAGIDFVEDIDSVGVVEEDIDSVGVVEEDSLGRRELAVVEVLDHRQVVLSRMDSAVAAGHCNSAGHRIYHLRNNLDLTC
jgi:hypothetical protein